MAERIVRFRARTVFLVLGLLLAVAALVKILFIARHVITWILIALFLTLALDPAVGFFQRHGLRKRGLATGVTYLLTLAALAGIGALFVPPVVRQVDNFTKAVPGYVEDITKGRGQLGFLQTRYHLVDKVKKEVGKSGASKKLFGLSGAALSVTKSVITIIVGIVTIAFMTFFMLLEGRDWMERLYGLLPDKSQPRWRGIGRDIHRTVGGYVTGNLLISLIAGTATALVLWVVGLGEYALALGLIVAILDLIPLAGATLAAIIVVTVTGLSEGFVKAAIVTVFFILYQQLENHLLQPLIYGRTVQLSPLVVLIAVLIGAELAGVLGALGAIPVAGSIQVLLRDWHANRNALEAPL